MERALDDEVCCGFEIVGGDDFDLDDTSEARRGLPEGSMAEDVLNPLDIDDFLQDGGRYINQNLVGLFEDETGECEWHPLGIEADVLRIIRNESSAKAYLHGIAVSIGYGIQRDRIESDLIGALVCLEVYGKDKENHLVCYYPSSLTSRQD